MKVCAITNVYNESFNLPRWLHHYGSQIGIENCIVVDHGSDDGSTDDLRGASRILIPRTTFSDHVRARLISNLANTMLEAFDAVIYSDCDELLVANPIRHKNLVEFASMMEGPCATAIGLNIVHNLAFEGAFDYRKSIFDQRRYVHFVSPMCKSLIIKKPVTWGGGFHSSNHPPKFGDLYLFHLRWMDLGEGIKRLTITRNIAFADNIAGAHHRASYLDYMKGFQSVASKPIDEEFDFSIYIDRLAQTFVQNDGGLYHTKTDLRSNSLYKIPDEFSLVL